MDDFTSGGRGRGGEGKKTEEAFISNQNGFKPSVLF